MSRTSPIVAMAIAVAGMLALAPGCKNADAPKNGNGPNDVRVACELKTQWVRANNQCNICEASVVSPRCSCTELAAFSGSCVDQEDAWKADCPEPVADCVYNCKTTDCACIEACYANDAKCKGAAAARDGCQVEACSSYCK